MTVQLDHTIVQVHDKHESAGFLADLFGLPAPVTTGPFVVVDIDGVSLDFGTATGDITPQHYAFCVTDQEFDAIFARTLDRGLAYWADPRRSRPNEIRRNGRSRGFYFEEPSGHFLEVLTRVDEPAGVT